MDLNSLLDPSHLLTFLGGTAVGAAGKYYADKFTDQRKKKEERVEQEAAYDKLAKSMPDLIAEMRADLLREADRFIRELVVLPNERVIFNSECPRLAYYESQHPGLRAKIAALADAGHLKTVRIEGAPIYRFRESFAERLTK